MRNSQILNGQNNVTSTEIHFKKRGNKSLNILNKFSELKERPDLPIGGSGVLIHSNQGMNFTE